MLPTPNPPIARWQLRPRCSRNWVSKSASAATRTVWSQTKNMRVGIIGTGAISHKHVQAYRNIGYEVTVCTDINPEYGRKFAAQYGCEFAPCYEALCRHAHGDYVDVCTFPDFRLQPLKICAQACEHIHVQQPISTTRS